MCSGAGLPPAARAPRTPSLAGDQAAPAWAAMPAASLRQFRFPCNVWWGRRYFSGIKIVGNSAPNISDDSPTIGSLFGVAVGRKSEQVYRVSGCLLRKVREKFLNVMAAVRGGNGTNACGLLARLSCRRSFRVWLPMIIDLN